MPLTESEHYEEAKRHVAVAEEQIARQKQIIDELAVGGHDTAIAEQLLQTLESTLQGMREHLRQVGEDGH